jgi:hypothetical protein
VQTPYVQAIVRTGFADYNTTSFYGESFRNLMSLPVMDWGFIFRPLHWGYAVLPPASLAIFLAPFTQSWWTGLAPLCALFPWVLVVLHWRGSLLLRAPLIAWLVASWIVSAAYLPGLVLLSFVGVLVVAALMLRRETVQPLAVLGLASLLGVGVALLYLAPVLRILSATVYPGQRVVPGAAFRPRSG